MPRPPPSKNEGQRLCQRPLTASHHLRQFTVIDEARADTAAKNTVSHDPTPATAEPESTSTASDTTYSTRPNRRYQRVTAKTGSGRNR
jgi:hypothetical protein